jgi:hypothetical protein
MVTKMGWIEARLKCSPESAWTLLRETLLSDIEDWRKLTRAEAGSLLIANDDRRISITSKADDVGEGAWVSVQKKESQIQVRRPHPSQPNDYVAFDLVPRLNQSGECRLWLGEEELEFWQASRRILEPVLFR